MTFNFADIKLNPTPVLSVKDFTTVKCGMSGNRQEVYFVRAVGVNSSLVSDVENMDSCLNTQMSAGGSAYLRISTLPKLASTADTGYYSNCYSQWLSNGRQVMPSKTADCAVQGLLSKVCNEALSALKLINPAFSSSIEKNFIVKLVFWYDSIITALPNIGKTVSVKIVAENIVRRHEYLFFYMLALMGFSVLLMQSRGDIDNECERLGFSKKFILGSFENISIPPYNPNNMLGCANSINARNTQPVQNTYGYKTVQNNSSTAGNNNNGNIRVQIPSRPQRKRGNHTVPPAVVNGGRTSAGTVNANMSVPSQNRGTAVRAEKSFEDLALMAKSVVMIAIHNERGDIVASGSGIMIGRSGYILTNNHVASGGCFYSVRIEDENMIYETDEVIKYNPVLDLAVIRIERMLTPIPVYNGIKDLARGQRVVAIGSPLGLFNSVSDGIISGFRNVKNVDMIQFTAPISSGSSGGAVLNMYGEVIGISTAGIDEGQNINLAVGYRYINPFIRGFI